MGREESPFFSVSLVFVVVTLILATGGWSAPLLYILKVLKVIKMHFWYVQ